MKSLLRLITAVAFVGCVWAVSEYVSLQGAVILVAALVAMADFHTEERLDRISKALEMHSKRLFPEYWD